MSRRSLRCVFTAVSLVLAACGGATEPIDGSLTPPPSETLPPSPTPVPGEAVTFRTSDGVRIAGRLFGEGRVGVVLGHSIDGDQTEWWNFAEVVTDAGHRGARDRLPRLLPRRRGGVLGGREHR
jgi:hypothetical protein